MKILLRKFDGKEYVWEDAEYKKDRFYVGGTPVYETGIVSIIDDERDQYVKCSNCGKIFKKDSPEIEKHKNKYKDINTCFSCIYKRHYNNVILNTNYECISDGVFKYTKEEKVDVVCNSQYRYNGQPCIGTEEAQNQCIHKKCADATYDAFTDFFIENPGAFDDIITIDKIITAGYRDVIDGAIETHYLMRGKNKIYAVVNSMSIVDHFRIEYYSDCWDIVYSKKLNKLFSIGYTNYTEWEPSRVPASTREYIKNKIAQLYN